MQEVIRMQVIWEHLKIMTQHMWEKLERFGELKWILNKETVINVSAALLETSQFSFLNSMRVWKFFRQWMPVSSNSWIERIFTIFCLSTLLMFVVSNVIKFSMWSCYIDPWKQISILVDMLFGHDTIHFNQFSTPGQDFYLILHSDYRI